MRSTVFTLQQKQPKSGITRTQLQQSQLTCLSCFDCRLKAIIMSLISSVHYDVLRLIFSDWILWSVWHYLILHIAIMTQDICCWIASTQELYLIKTQNALDVWIIWRGLKYVMWQFQSCMCKIFSAHRLMRCLDSKG